VTKPATTRRLPVTSTPKAKDLDGGRLARAVGTEEAEDLARPDLEIDAVDGCDVGVALDQAAHPDDRFPGDRGGRTLPRRGPGQSFFRR
jgi:hypothetical protein